MATTPIDPRVIERMLAFMGPEAHFGNPASTTHIYGQVAATAVEHARQQIADNIGATPEDIIFTSGATEANNLAIFGAARFYHMKGRHVITLSTEHKAVLDCMKQLTREDFEVTYLTPKADGLLDLAELERALRDDTILVSVMQVNNEIGVIQDIAAIAAMLRGRGIVFQVDAAQSAGKLPIDLSQMPVDLMSFSAHKLYGPKGIGALFVRHRPRIRLQPILFGGGHEHGLRSGTLPTHQIVGMGEAFSIATSCREDEQARLLRLRERLWDGIRMLPGVQLNGHAEQRVAGNLNVSFGSLEAMQILPAISELAVSTSSACMSAKEDVSHVLRALGMSRERALSSLRMSVGRFTTDENIEDAIRIICRAIRQLNEV
jgi:cysteine desulfurase